MQKVPWLEIIGWLGGILLIVAYALNSYQVLTAQSLFYQCLNLTASIILAWYTYKKKAYPNVALNIVWTIIAVIAIVGIFRN